MGKNVTHINVGITINFDVSTKCHVCEKNYVWNPTTCSCESGKYLVCIMDNSEIICDEVIDEEAKPNDEEKKNSSNKF